MDFDDVNKMTWNWQELDRSLLEQPQYEISSWTDDTTNQEYISNTINFTNATPVKACLDAEWKVTERDDLMKEYEESRAYSSQAKRRRMLQFNDEPMEFSLCTEELPSPYLQQKARQESAECSLPEVSTWNGISSEFAKGSNFEKTEQDYWLDELLNDTDMTLSATSDVHFSISDFCECQEVHHIQKWAPPAVTAAPKTLSGKVIFKGRTSYFKTPTNRASCVVYPFTFIKPCPIKGGMTLQDINRKILTPPERTLVPPNLLRSAISGKLVVRKTRIRTGGNGSVTITRTRG